MSGFPPVLVLWFVLIGLPFMPEGHSTFDHPFLSFWLLLNHPVDELLE